MPLYDSYCFSRISATISAILSGDALPAIGGNNLPSSIFPDEARKYDHVILILIDGLGWNVVEHLFSEIAAIDLPCEAAKLSKLTSIFPSTTSACLTTLYSGRPVSEHGIYEWTYYDSRLGLNLSPLLNSHAKDAYGSGRRAETLGEVAEQNIHAILPRTALSENLSNRDVEVKVFCPEYISKSTYSATMLRGGTIEGYISFDRGIASLLNGMGTSMARKFTYFYYPKIDGLSHEFGPFAQQTLSEAQGVFRSLRHMLEVLKRQSESSTLVLITSDHGHAPIAPEQTIYLDEVIPDIRSYLRMDKFGAPLIPTGALRDLFLHVREERLEELELRLHRELAGRVEVRRLTPEVIAPLFGAAAPHEVFLRNLGNLLLLPQGSRSVWFRQGMVYECLRGAHGGLSAAEMEIPFFACKI